MTDDYDVDPFVMSMVSVQMDEQSADNQNLKNKANYRSCFIPSCSNTTRNTNKLFVSVPKKIELRAKWFKAASLKSVMNGQIYCCQDHFVLEKDSENYAQSLTSSNNLRLKDGVIPHIFDGRNKNNRNNSSSILEDLLRLNKLSNGLTKNTDENSKDASVINIKTDPDCPTVQNDENKEVEELDKSDSSNKRNASGNKTPNNDRLMANRTSKVISNQPVCRNVELSLQQEKTNFNKLHELQAEEITYRKRSYKVLNTILIQKLHCTICDVHIGFHGALLKLTTTHPLLRVLVCAACATFYSTLTKFIGKDGVDIRCRWCGKVPRNQKNLHTCTKCPFSFCETCLQKNFPRFTQFPITNWTCFVCNQQNLYEHRAKCWAFSFLLQNVYNTAPGKNSVTDTEADLSKCCGMPTVNYTIPAFHVSEPTTKTGAKIIDKKILPQVGNISIPKLNDSIRPRLIIKTPTQINSSATAIRSVMGFSAISNIGKSAQILHTSTDFLASGEWVVRNIDNLMKNFRTSLDRVAILKNTIKMPMDRFTVKLKVAQISKMYDEFKAQLIQGQAVLDKLSSSYDNLPADVINRDGSSTSVNASSVTSTSNVPKILAITGGLKRPVAEVKDSENQALGKKIKMTESEYSKMRRETLGMTTPVIKLFELEHLKIPKEDWDELRKTYADELGFTIKKTKRIVGKNLARKSVAEPKSDAETNEKEENSEITEKTIDDEENKESSAEDDNEKKLKMKKNKKVNFLIEAEENDEEKQKDHSDNENENKIESNSDNEKLDENVKKNRSNVELMEVDDPKSDSDSSNKPEVDGKHVESEATISDNERNPETLEESNEEKELTDEDNIKNNSDDDNNKNNSEDENNKNNSDDESVKNISDDENNKNNSEDDNKNVSDDESNKNVSDEDNCKVSNDENVEGTSDDGTKQSDLDDNNGSPDDNADNESNKEEASGEDNGKDEIDEENTGRNSDGCLDKDDSDAQEISDDDKTKRNGEKCSQEDDDNDDDENIENADDENDENNDNADNTDSENQNVEDVNMRHSEEENSGSETGRCSNDENTENHSSDDNTKDNEDECMDIDEEENVENSNDGSGSPIVSNGGVGDVNSSDSDDTRKKKLKKLKKKLKKEKKQKKRIERKLKKLHKRNILGGDLELNAALQSD